MTDVRGILVSERKVERDFVAGNLERFRAILR